jgi:hypothetical protein
MSTAKTTLKGQATPEQIATWKKENPDGISGFQTKDGRIAYYKNPSREILKMATDSVTNGVSEYNDTVEENCFLAGDESIRTDANCYSALNSYINKISKAVEGDLVKL